MNKQIYFSILLLFFSCTSSISQTAGRIFYSTFSPQDWDIYISKDQGKSFEKFTDHPSLDYDAVISPDGKWVVFTSERSGVPKLYVQSVDGNQSAALLINSSSLQDQAAFSPDGSKLAFVGSHEGNSEIYLMPFMPDSIQDVSMAVNITNNSGGDFRPAFSPDGKRIAFSSDRGHEIIPHPRFSFARQRIGDIYSVDDSGNNLKRLTDSEFWDGSPQWSDDGTRIVFYSGRAGFNSIFEMNANGLDQKQLIDFSGPAVSPQYVANGKVAFTTWQSERDFKIMLYDVKTKIASPLFLQNLDLMFNVNIHPNGTIVFHGGKYAPSLGAPGKFGFDGDALAKLPDTLVFANQKVQAFGLRRAFVAPPQKGNTLLFYDASDIQSFFGVFKPLGYSMFLLPVLMVVLFLLGIVLGIVHRKLISFWRYLFFSLLTVIFGVVTGAVFLFVDTINPMPVLTIRVTMGALTLVLSLLAWWQYKKSRLLQHSAKETYRVAKLYCWLFIGLSIFSLACSAFINQFVHSSIHFYQVDYLTGEKMPLFSLEKESNTNPANFRVLDSKILHDGKSFIFTTGSFRGNAGTQGDIWKYDFETKNVAKLADSPFNDGFADISENGKMVFRSGRSGDFDIYLQIGGEIINLTHDAHRDNFPSISIQGDKIVFSSDRLRKAGEYKTMDIFLMNLTPDNTWTEPTMVSMGQGQNAHAHFSPDGEWIIYTTEAYGINDEQALIQPIIFSPQMYGEIVAFNLTTKEHIRITHNKWEDGTPLWVEY
ncbi:MAG: PD40 domain-containing protein [Saprospiraceae bacterium]|nr:PD40 domain-containing protein [Saprospiraceae bacterium]